MRKVKNLNKLLFSMISFMITVNTYANTEVAAYNNLMTIFQQSCFELTETIELEIDPQSDLTEVNALNLLRFLSNPFHYANTYRSQIDEYYFESNGGRDSVYAYAGRISAEDVDGEVESLLRWNARNPMIMFKYEFCANALTLQNWVNDLGCTGINAPQFEQAQNYCEDPFDY